MQVATNPYQAVMANIDGLEALLIGASAQAEEDKRLPQPVVDGLRDAGLYRLFRPKALGGLELDPVSEFRIAEALARVDSAAAWNIQVCNAGDLYGGWFGKEAIDEVFSDDAAIVAGSFNPPRQAVPTDGGYLLTGTTPFNSNCHGADWFMGVAVECDEAGKPVQKHGDAPGLMLTLVPTGECRIVENWDTMGLGGTGSHDVAISEVFVPGHRVVPFTPSVKPGPEYDGVLARMAIWVTAASHAAVALGIARAAINDLVDLSERVSAYTEDSLRNKPRNQTLLAQAEAKLNSARLYFHQAYADAWEQIEAAGELSLKDKAQCQLATTNAVSASAEAVRLVHACVGTAGIRKSHQFEKYFRDVHVITQHAFVSEARLEAVGQAMFGLEPDWPFFAF